MEEEKDAQSRIDEANRKYFKSDKGKQAVKRYLESEKGKETRKRYYNSEGGKKASLKYYLSERGQETRAKREQKRQMLSDCKQWLESNPGKTPQDFLKENGYA